MITLSFVYDEKTVVINKHIGDRVGDVALTALDLLIDNNDEIFFFDTVCVKCDFTRSIIF